MQKVKCRGQELCLWLVIICFPNCKVIKGQFCSAPLLHLEAKGKREMTQVNSLNKKRGKSQWFLPSQWERTFLLSMSHLSASWCCDIMVCVWLVLSFLLRAVCDFSYGAFFILRKKNFFVKHMDFLFQNFFLFFLFFFLSVAWSTTTVAVLK